MHSEGFEAHSLKLERRNSEDMWQTRKFREYYGGKFDQNTLYAYLRFLNNILKRSRTLDKTRLSSFAFSEMIEDFF